MQLSKKNTLLRQTYKVVIGATVPDERNDHQKRESYYPSYTLSTFLVYYAFTTPVGFLYNHIPDFTVWIKVTTRQHSTKTTNENVEKDIFHELSNFLYFFFLNKSL